VCYEICNPLKHNRLHVSTNIVNNITLLYAETPTYNNVGNICINHNIPTPQHRHQIEYVIITYMLHVVDTN